MTLASVLTAAILALLLLAPTSLARSSVAIYTYSQEASSEQAQAGASVSYTHSTAGSRGSEAPASPGVGSPESATPSFSSAGEPSTTASAPGPETECVRAGEASVSPCFGVVSVPTPAGRPRPGRGRPAVNPVVLAARVAEQLSLEPGRVEASPSVQTAGLTGAASWFWLAPPPGPRSLSVAVGGERVTVSASAQEVSWAFGDGAQSASGPGVPYRPGPAPEGSVRHTYQTRCLPGDRGHDPYVRASCGPHGYTVAANVLWGISFQATGPVNASGALPPRRTASSISYPVSEARAFLTANGGGS